MPFIPKNALAILRNKNLQREFFLKPFGLQVFIIVIIDTKKWEIPKIALTKKVFRFRYSSS